MLKNKKGQMGGLITGLVFGIASLVIGVTIAFVIVSTLTNANLLTSGRTTITITNEIGFVNITTYTLTGASTANVVSGGYAITGLVNYTDGTSILLPNATTTSAGVVSNLTTQVWNNVTMNYTYITKSDEEVSTSALSDNFSAGIDNVSSKIPTVLLVAAIVLILGVLALLVGAWQSMRMNSGGGI